MKILLTDGGQKQTLGIVRLLGKRGHYIGVTSPQKIRTTSFASKYCREKYVLPKGEKEQLDFYKYILEKDMYDLLMPVGYSSTLFCAKYKDLLTQYSDMVVPEYETIKLSADKSEVYDLSKKLNVPAPVTEEIHSMEDLETISDQMEYPVVLKAKYEISDHLVEYCNNREELLNKYSRAVKDKRLNQGDPLLLQDYINGPGFGFFAFYINGELKKFFMHKRIREYPVSGGASVLAKSVRVKEVFEYGKKVLDFLKWNGVAMVEFKYDINRKKYYLIEINPKFWGSHDCSLSSGVEFPQYIVDYVSNNYLNSHNDYSEDNYFLWPLVGMFQNIIVHPSDIFFFTRILMTGRCKTNIFMSDIKPHFIELLNNVLVMGKEASDWLRR